MGTLFCQLVSPDLGFFECTLGRLGALQSFFFLPHSWENFQLPFNDLPLIKRTEAAGSACAPDPILSAVKFGEIAQICQIFPHRKGEGGLEGGAQGSRGGSSRSRLC